MRVLAVGRSPEAGDGGDEAAEQRRKQQWLESVQESEDGVPEAAGAPAAGSVDERLQALFDEGRRIFGSFESEVRRHTFHTFVPGDYECVLSALRQVRRGRQRFLELGSGTGVITIAADLLGYEACGIEIDAELVEVARHLAARYGSAARFATGSFLPAGYEWKAADGDARLGTIGLAAPAYAELGHLLADFDVVYGYPWYGEEAILHDLMARRGRDGARLLVHGGAGGVTVYCHGQPEAPPAGGR